MCVSEVSKTREKWKMKVFRMSMHVRGWFWSFIYRGNEQIEVGLVLILNIEEWLELELFSWSILVFGNIQAFGLSGCSKGESYLKQLRYYSKTKSDVTKMGFLRCNNQQQDLCKNGSISISINTFMHFLSFHLCSLFFIFQKWTTRTPTWEWWMEEKNEQKLKNAKL